MSHTNFQVSVIIPAYNAEVFLERAVQSALQHPEVKELILVEDGSTDNTLQVCKNLAKTSSIIKVFQHPNLINNGAGASRNLGIKNATKEFIAFLDADDYFTGIRFQKEKEIFKNNPDAQGVYGAIGVEYLDVVGAKAWKEKGLHQQSLTTVNKSILPEHLFKYLISVENPANYEGYFSIDGLTVKRNTLLDTGLQFNPSLRLHQDTVFIWQLSYYLKLVTGELDRAIAMRGVHANNRFIHATKIHTSRSKQFKVLRDWSVRENLDQKVINRFQKKFFEHTIRSKNKLQLPFFYIYLLFSDNITQRNFGRKQLKVIWKLWRGVL